MDIERKALYNLLRMNWLSNSDVVAEPWQVQDYRALSLPSIFEQLSKFGLELDRSSFIAMAEPFDTPEELTDNLLKEVEITPQGQDKIYLLVFELWRRLIPEKMGLSVLCDELDYQIFLYDQGNPTSFESIQDILANLQKLMDDSIDVGAKPDLVFSSICAASANDIESFLYDYISEQIDTGNISYAMELMDGFGGYVKGSIWFELLDVRLLEFTDKDTFKESLKKIVAKACKEDDLSYNLEVMSAIVQGGEVADFNRMVKKTVPLVQKEDDFQDLLVMCTDFYRCIDEENRELAIQEIIDQRDANKLEEKVGSDDPHIKELMNIIK